MNLEIGAPVRTRDGRHIGEVHRILVDLEDSAAVGIVVLKGRLLARDVLVPLDFVDHVDGDTVVLALDDNELDRLPDFVFNEILAPPPTWTAGPYPDGTFYVPVRQRKRLGQHQVDLTPGTAVHALDGEIGRVDQIELDPVSGELEAFWIRADGVFGHDIRVPVEWVQRADDSGVYVKGSRSDIETRLGPPSRGLASRAQ